MGNIILHFYNGITGTVPREDLKLNGYSNKPSNEFYLGQVIKIRVINRKPKNKRILCSLNLNPINDNIITNNMTNKL